MSVSALAFNAATKIAVQQLTKQLLPHLTSPLVKKKLFTEFERQLQYVHVSSSQIQYVQKQLEQPACLRNLVKLTTVEDVRSEVVRALDFPENLPADDPRALEASLSTLALLRALVVVTAPDPHHALTADLQVLSLSNAESIFPGLGAILGEHQRRKKAPLTTSGEAIARLLQRAGQSDLQVTLSADGPLQLSGTARATLHLPSGHLEAVKQWMTEQQSETLVLKWADGMRMSYGDPELDALLVPQGKFNMHIALQPVVYTLRLKVSNGTEARVLPAAMTFHPGGKGRTLSVGHERFMLKIHSPDEHQKVTVQVAYNAGQYALPPEDESLLEGLLLLMRPGGQALILRGENSVTGHVVEVDTPRPFIQMPQTAQDQEFLTPVELHLTLLRLTQLAIKRGFDPLSLTIPEHFDNDEIEGLLNVRRMLQRDEENRKVVFSLAVERHTSPQLKPDWGKSVVTHRSVFRLGAAYFFAEQPVGELKVLGQKRRKTHAEVTLEGELREGTLEVLTEGQFEEKWAD